jgi:hypothetical protein
MPGNHWRNKAFDIKAFQNYNEIVLVVIRNCMLHGIFEVSKMSEYTKNGNEFSLKNINEMITGYQEMGMLNLSLSEEGLDLDRKDLESYEKYLVESE